MNIENLTAQEISDKIKEYLPVFVRKSEKVKSGANIFDECCRLEFDEIKDSIPRKYRKYFKGIDTVNCLSGIIESAGTHHRAKSHDYTITLLTDAESTQAILLIMQITSKRTGKSERVVLKNFLEETSAKEKDPLMVELLRQFHALLVEVQQTIESDMDNIISNGVDEQFKKLLYNLVIQSILVLRNNA